MMHVKKNCRNRLIIMRSTLKNAPMILIIFLEPGLMI